MTFEDGPVPPGGTVDGSTLARSVFGIWNHCPGARLETQDGVTTGGGGAGGSGVGVGDGLGVGFGLGFGLGFGFGVGFGVVGAGVVVGEATAEPVPLSLPPPQAQRAEAAISEARSIFLIGR
jgi:hypothetical protein